MSEEAVNLAVTFKCKKKTFIDILTTAENFNFADWFISYG